MQIKSIRTKFLIIFLPLFTDPVLTDAFKKSVSSDEQFSAYYTAAGGENPAVFTPIKLDGGRTWIAVSVVPAAEINADANTFLKSMGINSLVVMILAVGIIVWLSRKFAGPIR